MMSLKIVAQPSCAIFCAILFFCSISSSRSEGLKGYDAAWKDMQSLQFSEANKAFRQPAEASIERERSLGEGISLLSLQPRTPSNVERARALFAELAKGDSADRISNIARFFEARVLEVHSNPMQPLEAEKKYRSLLELRTGLPLAELSAAKLAQILLYREMSQKEVQETLADLERLEPLLQTAAGRREFHAAVGMALLDRNEMPEAALRHLLAADQEGLLRASTETQSWVSIGRLAEQLKQPELAQKYYRKFLAKYLRDNRSYDISLRLEALNKTLEPST